MSAANVNPKKVALLKQIRSLIDCLVNIKDETGEFLMTLEDGREIEVLRLVAKGLSYKQIAERLVISHRTVQNHVQNTLGKLQLHNRVELVRYAIERGLDDE